MKNADMPAMPVDGDFWFDSTKPELGTESYHGLTKREMFAMHAMQGLLSSDNSSICFYKSDSDAVHIAQSSVAYADALLAELEK